MTLKPHESIVDKWEKAVIAGIKNQNAKMQSNEQKNNTEISSDENNSVFGSVANNLGAESNISQNNINVNNQQCIPTLTTSIVKSRINRLSTIACSNVLLDR